MKVELELTTTKQITIRDDVNKTIECFPDQLIAWKTTLTTGRDPMPLAVPSQKLPKGSTMTQETFGIISIN